jgi:hypothetical protein
LQVFAVCLVVVTAMVSAHGCRKSSGAVPVQGHVSFQGQPLENATLTFFPASGRPVDAAVSNGEYATQLVPGDYTSVVSIAVEMPPGYGRTHWNQLPPQKFVLPDEYTTRKKSKLKATVIATQSEPVNFDLK